MTEAQKNLKNYPKFYIFFHAYAWASVFFLYFLENLPIEQVLLLESVYYIAAVFFEVPSGYFSDRIGRKPTLIIATLAQIIAYSLFLVGGHFYVFFLAQLFFAIAYTFASGTDQSFYFESVTQTEGKASSYGQLEARLMKKAMLFRSFSQLMAGVLSVLTLKFGYLVSLLYALTAFFYATKFNELNTADKTKESFAKQLKNSFKYWKNPLLQWVAFFVLIFQISTHFPYEFFQKYIDLLNLGTLETYKGYSLTTVVTGAVASSAIFIAAFVAGKSINIKNKIGFKNTMILSVAITALILFGMSYFLRSWVLLLILMRSMPSALSRAPMSAEISPLIATSERATFMSVNSLIGRLGYGLTLVLLSYVVSGNPDNWSTLSYLNKIGFIIAVSGLFILFCWSQVLPKRPNKAAV